MKKLVAVLLVVMMLFTQAYAHVVGYDPFLYPEMEGLMPITSIKILAIGNSFSVDSMQWLLDILNDLGVKDIVLGNLYIGGCSLQTHSQNAQENAEKYTYYKCSQDTDGEWKTVEGKKSIMYGLQDEDWDYISLQQASGYSGISSSYEPYLSEIINYVRANSRAKLMWNMTWAYQGDSNHGDFARYGKSQDLMYRSIVNAVEEHIIGNGNIDYIIPCGTAVQNMRTSLMGDTLTRDGYHMDMIFGRYLLGVTWAKVLTGSDLMGLKTIPGDNAEISPIVLDIIRESVTNAYKKPFEVTNSFYMDTKNKTDHANRIANCYVDVTEQGVYDDKTGIFAFNHNGAVARHGMDIAYLGTKAVSLDGEICANIDGRFFVPQSFIDYMNGKSATALESEAFDVDMEIENVADEWQGKINLTNYLTSLDTNGKIKFTKPESLKGVELDIENSKDSMTSSVSFDIPKIATNENYYNFAFDYTTNGKKYSYDITKEIAFANKVEGIKIDGLIGEGEWDSAYVITCDKDSQATNLKDWDGISDISAKTYVAWDEENFYLCGVAQDNIFTPPTKENSPWDGDSIQFAVFHDNGNFTFTPGRARSDFNELAISSIGGKASVYKSKAQTKEAQTGVMENVEAAVVNNASQTAYEVAIAWKDLLGYDFAPKDNDVLGFSLLYNDNDGAGRKGWIEYASGIGGEKNANEFSQLYLASAKEESDEISVFVNGKRLTFDQPPVLENDRTLVPLRAIFEELGAVVVWSDQSQTALAVKGDMQITVKIGADVMTANDKEINLDVPPQLINDRTLVPLRAIAQAFGNNVEWLEATQTVVITD
ncbi:MAG: DUF4886 domain-containing protein [Eubacteriales bacterium]|nr:DUF4886 domain-containing protein [Eubacteriales bacterium]